MEIEFCITESRITVPDCGEITVYGIAITTATDRVAVLDVSTDRGAVECLCDKMRQHGLSPLHLKDVVEDFLAK